MQNHASGTFEVKLSPQPADPAVGDPAVGRLALDKTFSGELQGTSRGQMLAVRSAVEGSAGYVAMEHVVATLGGRSGSFALQHFGLMRRGQPELTITVVPDSGAGQLTGIDGSMKITITDGKHFYDFDYTVPATP